ncbi:MAG: DUF5687 family protein, partial [Bacteroidota bacterium]
PIGFINRYLLEIFIGLFSLRFFLQQGQKLKMQPYLHLPISLKRLVYFFQAFSLLSFHNIIPYLFFIPFSIRYLWQGYPGPGGAMFWLAGITLILLISHYTNNLLRAILTKNTWFYVLTISVFASLLVLDQVINTQYLQLFSEILFEELLRQNLILLGLLLSLAVSIVLYSSALIQQNLLASPVVAQHQRTQRTNIIFAPERGQVLNLILLELKMIWRNKRPKHYFLLSVVFAVAYIALMLTESQVFSSRAISAIIGIFASGTFALNYGQLMFSWESTYFDGFLARNIRPEELILAKLMLLQGSCLVFFLISLPLFIFLSPNLLLLHVTFLFYNAGVTSVLMLALAVRNQRRVNIARSGSFFNYEGFSAMHWLWILPTITPPAILLYFLENITWTALLFIGGIGVTSLVLSKRWSLFFTEQLLDKKYVMASGFRQYES